MSTKTSIDNNIDTNVDTNIETNVETNINDSNVSGHIASLLRSRRTINNFKPELPPRELIVNAIDIARFAPNHHLTEPWHFYLLGDDSKNAIVELNAEIVSRDRGPDAAAKKRTRWAQIPGWLVVSCDRSEDPVTAREDYAATCCAIHSLTLYLWSMGVGCKWTSGAVTRDPGFYDTVWIDPEREEVAGLIWYGYPENIPDTNRKPVDQIFVEI